METFWDLLNLAPTSVVFLKCLAIFWEDIPHWHYLRDELCSSCTVDEEDPNLSWHINPQNTQPKSEPSCRCFRNPAVTSWGNGTLLSHYLPRGFKKHPRWLLYIAGKLWTSNTKSHLETSPPRAPLLPGRNSPLGIQHHSWPRRWLQPVSCYRSPTVRHGPHEGPLGKCSVIAWANSRIAVSMLKHGKIFRKDMWRCLFLAFALKILKIRDSFTQPFSKPYKKLL